MLTLYGSTTSPYVRRLRILLKDQDYQFVNLNIFDVEGRAELKKLNPTMKVPMLEHDGQMLFDSRVIFRYLSQSVLEHPLTWPQENALTLIDSANDTLVQMFILSRSELDVTEDKLYFRVQRERLAELFAELEKQVAAGDYKQWQYPAICLYCLLDWALFRGVYSLEPYPELQAFYQQHQQRQDVQETDPRD